jgi:serine/threonine protein kinase
MALSAGDRLGPYEILDPLGAGGMGEVYRARDTRLDRVIAVKVLPSEFSTSPKRRERLEREARAVSQLSHPHICTLYDIGREGETDFLVMEYLEGESLADRLGRGRLPVEQALRYASEIADALHDAHRHGVVHRDLKPGNVMLTKSGAKLLDFGLAKLHETASVDDAELASSLPTTGAPLTEEGIIVGTYPYMAPEQLEGKPVDGRTDLFALGAILYEMVTGQRPFLGDSRASLIAAIMSSQPRPMRELVPLTPPSLDRVVRRCLEKDPDERRESAGDLAAELRWIHSLDAYSEEASRTTGGAATRRMTASAATALAFVVAGGLLGWKLGPGASAPDGVFRTARQVTFQKGTERQPALSPDGRYVVYVSDANGNTEGRSSSGRTSLNRTFGFSRPPTPKATNDTRRIWPA